MGKNVMRAAGALLLVNICVKLLGFVREMVMADGFGASALSDAYWVGNTIPYFLQAILGYAFVSAVLPALNACWERGADEEAWRLGSTLLNVVALAMLALTALGVAAAPLLVWLTAPALDAQTAALATDMTRIIFPSLLFMSVGMVVSGVLNSRYRFVAAAVAPGLVSLCIIISVAVFARGNIYIAAIGTLVGYACFLGVQLPDLRRSGFRYQLTCDLRQPAVRRILADLLPIVLGLSVNQLYTIINRIFASGLAEGSISVLNYAQRLRDLPLGLFVAALITAAFPLLAELGRKTDKRELLDATARSTAMILLIVVPAAAGLMLLAQPIVQLLFESGSFDADDTLTTAQALTAMSPGLIFLAISTLLTRVYYVLDDVKTPLLTGFISVAVNVAASLVLVGPLAQTGLAWANSAAAAVNAVLMMLLLGRRYGFGNAYLRRSLWQTLLATALMLAVAGAAYALWPAVSGRMLLLVLVAVTVAAAVAVYFAALLLMKNQAVRDILRGLMQKNEK